MIVLGILKDDEGFVMTYDGDDEGRVPISMMSFVICSMTPTQQEVFAIKQQFEVREDYFNFPDFALIYDILYGNTDWR
jgi:hypothetical protein